MRTKGWIAALAMLTMLIGLPAVHADGPQTGTLEGRALDAEGTPLPGVTINLAGPQGQSSTVSGDDGDFRFGLLVAGEYTLGATLEGLGSTEVVGPARRRTAPAARSLARRRDRRDHHRHLGGAVDQQVRDQRVDRARG